MTDIDGNLVTMASFGTLGYGTLEPNSGSNEEQIQFTGITQNTNGTATLTGVSSVGFLSPYTVTSGVSKSHAGGVTFIISNTSAFYYNFANTQDDETIAGRWIFPSDNVNNAGIVADTDTTEATAFVTLGQLSRQAISGASNASTTVKGIIQLPTQAQTDARTTTGSTGALLVVTPDKVRSTLLSDYVIDTGTANTYAIAPSPTISAYATGQTFSFKAIHTNTGASTLNVNSLGTKNIFKRNNITLAAGDIVNGQIVAVEYDGTEFQMISPVGNVKISQNSSEVYAVSSTGTSAYAVGLTPSLSQYAAGLVVNFVTDTISEGGATLNVNSLGVKNIKKNNLGTLVSLDSSDIIPTQVTSVIYDGTQFQMTSRPASNPLISLQPGVTFASSTAENTLFSVSIPGGTLGTGNAIKFNISVSNFNVSNNGQTCILRLKYGGTTIATETITAVGSGSGAASGKIDGFIRSGGKTSSQIGSIFSYFGFNKYAPVNSGSIFMPQIGSATGTATETSTGALNLVVTAQFSNSGSTDNITTDFAIIEKSF